jgi:5S rRNA maturation endonuclease (ribonuclease M5)
MNYHSKNVPRQRKRTVNKNEILKKLTQREIFEYYFGKEINLSKVYNSPLRKDRNPSFGFYINRSGQLIGNDLAGKFCGDCFQFVMTLYYLTFKESLERIYSDFNLKNKPLITHKIFDFSEEEQKEKKKIQVKIRKNFLIKELEYWKQYGITKKVLNKYNVYSVSKLFLNKKLIAVSKSWDMIFVYHFPETDNIKVYRPLHKKYKWVSNVCKEDIYGIHQLSSQRDVIFLTSSLKDVMTLNTLEYDAIALQSETNHLSKKLIEKLLEYKKVIIFYDNDDAGRRCSNNVQKELNNSKIIYTPSEVWKDPSDYVKDNSLHELKKYINSKI